MSSTVAFRTEPVSHRLTDSADNNMARPRPVLGDSLESFHQPIRREMNIDTRPNERSPLSIIRYTAFTHMRRARETRCSRDRSKVRTIWTRLIVLLLAAVIATRATSPHVSDDTLTSLAEELVHTVDRHLRRQYASKSRFTQRRSGSGGSSEGSPKSKECLACESAMTTWRETFPCVGLSEPDWTPESAMEISACPWVATCTFFDVESGKRELCEGMKESFANDFVSTHGVLLGKRTEQDDKSASGEDDDVNPPQIFRNNNKKYVFESCKELGHCPDDEDCRKALLGDTCKDNPSCPEAAKCDDACYMCYWVLGSWFPLFTKPRAGTEGQDGFGNCAFSSFLELDEEPVRGVGSPDLVTSRGKATSKECLDAWRTIEKDPKARYMASYVSQLGSYEWNANTVCRCLGMCTYDSYVAFDLYRACSYEASDARVASLFPELMIGDTDEGGDAE